MCISHFTYLKVLCLSSLLIFGIDLFGQSEPKAHVFDMVQTSKAKNEIFAPVAIFQKETATLTDKNVEEAVSEATFLKLDISASKSLLQTAPNALQLTLPYGPGNVEVELVKVDILTDDFTVLTSDSDGLPVDYTPGIYYRGVQKGNPNSMATFSVFENEVFGMVSYAEVGTLVLGKLEKDGNKDEYILYADKDLLPMPDFQCDADLLEQPEIQIEQKEVPDKSMVLPHCVRQFLEADYDLYVNKGSVTATVNWLTSMFNEVITLYDNDFAGDGLSTEISQIYVWVSQDNYPTNSSSSALSTFISNRGTFTGDLAMLCALGGNNVGGIAYRPGICYSLPYGYSNISSSYSSVPTYSWTVNVMAHELGHNHGSPHTHACVWGPSKNQPVDCCGATAGYPDASCGGNCTSPLGPDGTIMSYCHLTSGIDFSLGFGSYVADTIRHYHNNVFSCLSACPTYSCAAPSGITITGIGSTQATINWTAVGGAASYNVQYKLNAASSWTTANTTNTSYTMTGLSAGDTYVAQIQTVCGGGSSAYATGAIFTTLLACPPIASNTLSSSNPVCASNDFTLSLSESYSGGYTFQWQSSPNNISYSNISGATSSTYIANQSSATWYQCIITCTGQNTTSTALQVTMESNSLNCYCTPSSTSCSFNNPVAYMRINRVQFGTLDNQNNTCSASGYGDYTSGHTIPDLTQNSTVTIYISIHQYAQKQVVFIDFNQDGDFNDSGEMTQVPYFAFVTQEVDISIPSNAVLGNTMMRVRSRNGTESFPTDPCSGGWLGETEDYLVNIVALLPAELTAFNAFISEENKTDLTWETASEINTSHFVVERSSNGIDFYELGKRNAHGNTDQNQFYRMIDESPVTGANYYRLKIVDYDGREDFSPVKSVYHRSNSFEILGLYPNPTKASFYLKYNTEKEKPVYFELADVTGRAIMSFESNASQGENISHIETTTLAPGIYFLTIFDGVTKMTERVVKY